MNGERMRYTQPQYDPADDAKKLIKGKQLSLGEGYISLQSESPVEFRKVEIKVLDRSNGGTGAQFLHL